jgi:hypothetical protein
MWMRSRKLTVITAASYLLVVSAAALFHDHDDHDHGLQKSDAAAAKLTDGHDCSVCQFLAQTPAPAAEVAPVRVSTLAQDVIVAAPACVARGVFTAWQSRAPPVLA